MTDPDPPRRPKVGDLLRCSSVRGPFIAEVSEICVFDGHDRLIVNRPGRGEQSYRFEATSPDLDVGWVFAEWMTLREISDRFESITVARVDMLTLLIGLHDGVGHRRWNEAEEATEYSPEAVLLIEREARGRGYALKAGLR